MLCTWLRLNLHGTDFSDENINLRQMKRHGTLKIISAADIESRNIVLLYMGRRARGFHMKFNVTP